MPENLTASVQAASVSTEADTLYCSGRWSVTGIGELRARLDRLELPQGERLKINGAAISGLDTAGAWVLLQIRQRMAAGAVDVLLEDFSPAQDRLVDYISTASENSDEVPSQQTRPTLFDRWAAASNDLLGFLAFIGEVVVSFFRGLRHPARIRWAEIFTDIYQSGVKALPIVGLLSFLMGVVIAYQGAVQLKLYGANIYIADLVGYSMLRELAPLLTAILICGRTGSAYAAQIGTMKVREEVAALQTIGIPPVDLLVLPKLLSLIIVMPLISVYADVMSIFGGMVMASTQLGIGFHAFLMRLNEAITFSTFMIGIGKTPVFAAIIAIVGCYQGFKVEGSAESVGRHTTISVVQAIFLVIVTDALFSVLFSMMGV